MNKLLAIATLTLLSIGGLYQSSFSTEIVSYQTRFTEWSNTFGKTYTPSEKAYRQAIYQANLEKIEAHNADTTQTYQMGENQFTDLTQEEFAAIFLTRKSNSQRDYINEYIPTNVAAAQVDWSSLTNVKDQGNCGSCWAFSAVGAVESFLRVTNNVNTPNLSEQQLVDCETTYSSGCDGGYENYGIKYAVNNGLTTATAYPYKGKKNSCSIAKGTYQPKGYNRITAANLQAAITKYPTTVAVDATNWSAYKSGIFNNCGSKNLNHAVLAVGYYADGTWIIKNSWASSWGESGFIRLKSGNTCGVTTEAYQAV